MKLFHYLALLWLWQNSEIQQGTVPRPLGIAGAREVFYLLQKFHKKP